MASDLPPLHDRLSEIAYSHHTEHDKIHLMLKAAKARDDRIVALLSAQEAEIAELRATLHLIGYNQTLLSQEMRALARATLDRPTPLPEGGQ